MLIDIIRTSQLWWWDSFTNDTFETSYSSLEAGSMPVEGLSAKYSWCFTFTPYSRSALERSSIVKIRRLSFCCLSLLSLTIADCLALQCLNLQWINREDFSRKGLIKFTQEKRKGHKNKDHNIIVGGKQSITHNKMIISKIFIFFTLLKQIATTLHAIHSYDISKFQLAILSRNNFWFLASQLNQQMIFSLVGMLRFSPFRKGSMEMDCHSCPFNKVLAAKQWKRADDRMILHSTNTYCKLRLGQRN